MYYLFVVQESEELTNEIMFSLSKKAQHKESGDFVFQPNTESYMTAIDKI